MNSDCVFVKGMKVEALVGVLDHEKSAPQPLEVDVALWMDLEPAGRNDRLELTTDYAEVFTEVQRHLREGHWCLVEALAQSLARHLLERYPAEEVEVTVRKPLALSGHGIPGVRLRRRR